MRNARMTSIVIARLTTWYECLPKEYWDENKIIKEVIKGFIESNGLDDIADRPYLSEKDQNITAEKQAAIGAKAFAVHLFRKKGVSRMDSILGWSLATTIQRRVMSQNLLPVCPI